MVQGLNFRVLGLSHVDGLYGNWVYLPLVSREWRNGVQLYLLLLPFSHSLLTQGRFRVLEAVTGWTRVLELDKECFQAPPEVLFSSIPRGSIYTTIMELGPKRPSPLWFWGPDCIWTLWDNRGPQ